MHIPLARGSSEAAAWRGSHSHMLMMYGEMQHEVGAVYAGCAYAAYGSDTQHAALEGVVRGKRYTARGSAGVEWTQEEA
jgi:hypothetical protein